MDNKWDKFFFLLKFVVSTITVTALFQMWCIPSILHRWDTSTNYQSLDCKNHCTKMKLFIKDFFSKWDQIRRKLRTLSYLLEKSLIESFIFSAVNTMNDAKVMFIVTKEVILRLKEIFMPNNDFEVEKETAKHILLLRKHSKYHCKDHYPARFTNCHTSKEL